MRTTSKIVENAGNKFPKEIEEVIAVITSNGGTPLVVCVNQKVTGVIELQDISNRAFRNVLSVFAGWV